MTAATKYPSAGLTQKDYLAECHARRDAIRADYAKTKSYAETARNFGITRQRAQQLVTGKRGKR